MSLKCVGISIEKTGVRVMSVSEGGGLLGVALLISFLFLLFMVGLFAYCVYAGVRAFRRWWKLP